jgi:PAS domain S-box-containing protein
MMSLKKTIIFLSSVYLLLSAGAYLMFFNNASYKDELFLVLALSVLGVLYLAILNPLLKKIQKLNQVLIPFTEQTKETVKLNEIDRAMLAINHFLKIEQNASIFINNILSGNLATSSVDENNKLMTSLFDLRSHIVSMLEKEKERNWVSEGIANFASILRAQGNDKNAFYDSIISNIVKYLNVNQGGLFIVSDDKSRLELASCYAYDRKKFLEKEIEPGQGLVGQVYLEKQTLILKQVPQDYITIRSGLGHAVPSYLVVVPCKLNDVIECVVELASFKEFKNFEIEFIEKLGESIASTIATLKINNSTKKLLVETQQSAEQMRAQEEELRQNMEELEATQEQMERKEKEMVNLVAKMAESEKVLKEKLDEIRTMKEQDEIKNQQMLKTIEEHRKMLIQIIDHVPQKIFLKDKDGKFILANTAVAKAHHRTVDELIGTSDFDHFSFEDATQYRKAEIALIKAGKPVYFPEEVFKDPSGEERILQTTKIPFFISHLNQTGLLGIQTDVTEMKKMQDALAGLNK